MVEFKKFLLCLVAVLLVTLGYDFVFPIYYQGNDTDWITYLIYSQTHNNSAVFVHDFLSYCIKFLDIYIDNRMDWFKITYFVSSIVSFAILLYIYINSVFLRNICIISKCIVGLFLLILYIVYCENLSFTSNASLSLCAGWFGVILSSKKKYWLTILSVLLVIYGGLMRCSILYVACVFNGLYLFCEYFETKRVKKAGLVFILLVVVGGAWQWNNSRDSVKQYLKYTVSRSTLIDYKYDLTPICTDECDKVGFGEEEQAVFFSWNMADPEVFNQTNMKVFAKAYLDSHRKQIQGKRAFLEFLFAENALLFGWGFMMFFFLYFSKGRFLYTASIVSVSSALLVYLFIHGRTPVRTYYFILLASTVYCSLISSYNSCWNVKKSQWVKKIIFSLLVVLVGYMCISYGLKERKIINDHDFKAYARAHQKQRFLLVQTHPYPSVTTSFLCRGWRQRDLVPYNTLPLGSWVAFTPAYNEMQVRLKIENPYRNCVEPDVYLILTGAEKNDILTLDIIQNYIQKHYYKHVHYSLIDTGSDYRVYQFFKK